MSIAEGIITTHLDSVLPGVPARPAFRTPPARPFIQYEVSDIEPVRTDSIPDVWLYSVELRIFDDNYTSARSLSKAIQKSLIGLEGANGTIDGDSFEILYVRDFSTSSETDEDQGHFSNLNFTLTIEEVTP